MGCCFIFYPHYFYEISDHIDDGKGIVIEYMARAFYLPGTDEVDSYIPPRSERCLAGCQMAMAATYCLHDLTGFAFGNNFLYFVFHFRIVEMHLHRIVQPSRACMA